MSPTDKVRELGGKVASGAKSGATKGLEGIVRPDPKYNYIIDAHRRALWITTGVPVSIIADKLSFTVGNFEFQPVSDLDSLKLRVVDFTVNFAIAGYLLRIREKVQDKFTSDTVEYTGLQRFRNDTILNTSYSIIGTFGMYYLGEPVFEAVKSVAQGSLPSLDAMFSYDSSTIAKSAIASIGLSALTGGVRLIVPDMVNLSYGREPAGKIPKYMKGWSKLEHRLAQAAVLTGSIAASVGLYLTL